MGGVGLYKAMFVLHVPSPYGMVGGLPGGQRTQVLHDCKVRPCERSEFRVLGFRVYVLNPIMEAEMFYHFPDTEN